MENSFTVEYNSQTVKIREMLISGSPAFIAWFPDQAPLVLVRANDANSDRFWTSVPEGRQQLAEEIGPLIAEQIAEQQKKAAHVLL